MSVLVRLDDLQNRARAACLDFGGVVSPETLRMLCCDATVVPIVMNGVGQPLDVGRATRTIPDGLRRAVAARDRGCAHPGCGRPQSWCEIHHVKEWERRYCPAGDEPPATVHGSAVDARAARSVHRRGRSGPP